MVVQCSYRMDSKGRAENDRGLNETEHCFWVAVRQVWTVPVLRLSEYSTTVLGLSLK